MREYESYNIDAYRDGCFYEKIAVWNTKNQPVSIAEIKANGYTEDEEGTLFYFHDDEE